MTDCVIYMKSLWPNLGHKQMLWPVEAKYRLLSHYIVINSGFSKNIYHYKIMVSYLSILL